MRRDRPSPAAVRSLHRTVARAARGAVHRTGLGGDELEGPADAAPRSWGARRAAPSAAVAGMAAPGSTRGLMGGRCAALVPGVVRAGAPGIPCGARRLHRALPAASRDGRSPTPARVDARLRRLVCRIPRIARAHLGALLVPVAVYGAVLGTMAALAGGRGGLIALGGAFFVVSDSVLALGRFLPGYEFALHDLVVMSTYLAAQGLIAWGVVTGLRADPAASARPSLAPDRRADATGR